MRQQISLKEARDLALEITKKTDERLEQERKVFLDSLLDNITDELRD